jgi:hypothetical protein
MAKEIRVRQIGSEQQEGVQVLKVPGTKPLKTFGVMRVAAAATVEERDATMETAKALKERLGLDMILVLDEGYEFTIHEVEEEPS